MRASNLIGAAVLLAISVSALLGCGTSAPKDDEALEVDVVVAPERIEVHAHHPGSCREVTAFPDTSACETFGWALLGVESSSTTDRCNPEPTCVDEIRLERGDDTVAALPGPSVAFYTSSIESDLRVVLTGCEDPMVVELPAPLEQDVDFDVEANGSTIDVAATSSSVVGVLGRAEGLMPYARGFMSSCRSESGPVALPTSDDFDSYSVTAFALGEPVSAGDAVRVFPARMHEEIFSKSADLGPLWDAALIVAQQSSLYPTCESYCSAWNETCWQGGEDVDRCSVSCVSAGVVVPDCEAEWNAFVSCLGDTLSCERAVAQTYSEDPSRRSSVADTSSCPDEERAYDECVN
jgi:hypothetical protein